MNFDERDRNDPRNPVYKIECARCQGTGQIETTEIIWDDEAKTYIKDHEVITCPDCDGMGEN